jgi:WD40 repeat protein
VYDQAEEACAGAVTALDYDPNGRTLVSGDDTGAVALWSLEGNRLLRLGPQRPAGVRVDAATFSANSDRLVTSGPGGTLMWNGEPSSWRRELCPVAGRDLTSSERRDYSPDLDSLQVCAA